MLLYLAPMEGVTNFIVRNALHNNFGCVDKFFTPFIPAAQRMNKKYLRDIIPENNPGIRLVPQLIANRSEDIFEMISQLKQFGYSEINLNFGCPSGTVTGSGRGSGMLKDAEYMDQYLDEIFSKADIPISIKTRIGFSSLDEWTRILNVYAKYPISELIIHTRLRSEFYEGSTHPEKFEEAYNMEVFHTPTSRLCYNGDLWNMECFSAIAERFPQLEKVMIGRGLVGRPDLGCCIKGIPVPDLRKKIRNYHDEIYSGYLSIYSGEKDAARHMKEIWSNLGRSFNNSEKLVKKIMKNSDPYEYRALVRQIFETLDLAER